MNFEPFLGYQRTQRSASPETLKAYRSDLAKFKEHLTAQGISRVTDVNHAVIGKYIDSMREAANPRKGKDGLSDATIARRLAAVSTYFDYLRGTGHSKLRNPVKEVPVRLKKNNGPKPVNEDALDRLLGSITSERDKTLIILFLASGLRVSEMQQLDRDSIQVKQFEDGNGGNSFIGVGEVIGKGSKRRTFYLDIESVRSLGKYLKTRAADEIPALFISEQKKRMSVRAMQERLAYWCKQAEVGHVRVHQLRHTYATRLANANINSIHLRELLGHNSFATTLQYFKLTDTTLARNYHAAMEFVRR